MADDAAGTDDDAGDERRPSTPDPDANRSSDERSTGSDRTPEHRDRLDRAADGESGDPGDDGDEYRIPLDLSRDDDATANDRGPNEDGDEDDPYTPEPSSTPIEPGDPDLENVIFVFLGAVAMALVLFRIMSLPL